MSVGIERRAKRELWYHCLVSPEFYESITNYAPSSSSYDQLIRKYLPAGWTLIKEGIWHHATPAGPILPPQGFKIHISATYKTAVTAIQRVLPILVEHKTYFKVLVDPFMLNCINSKNGSRAQSGKFIAIYPDNSRFTLLLEQLAKAMSDIEGPFILSDRPYKGSKTVFYRYGGFIPRFRLNVFGEKEPIINSPSGDEILDARTPYFRLPEGITDPFEPGELTHNGPVVLNGRFRIESTISHSNSGGVYKARDLVTDGLVLVKEARPLINMFAGHSSDAVETLHKEHKVLAAMQDTPYVPRLIAFFQHWEHHFLVEELMGGLLLSSFRAVESFNILLRKNIVPRDILEFCECIRKIALELLNAIKAFHARGFIIGDLSPNNVFVNSETMQVTLIDFEGCHIVREMAGSGESGIVDSMITLGFVPPSRLAGEPPSLKDDYYSLGSLIYSLIFPVQVLFPLNPAAARTFIQEISRDFGLPDEIQLSILDLLNNRLESGINQLQSGTFAIPEAPHAFALPSVAQMQNVVCGATDFILKTTDPTRDDRLWPSDYRVFSTNPLSLAYGALGIALVLKKVLGSVPEEVISWLSRRQVNTHDFPPGFFIGLSGIAWAYAELGMEERAHEAMALAFRSPLLSSGPDLFYGLAGFGLGNLYFWRHTQDERYLSRACEAGESLLRTAIHENTGCAWKNVDGRVYSGYAHGGSGIALFLLTLYGETKESRYLRTAQDALETEISWASDRDGGLAWPGIYPGVITPYWRYGSAGVGSILIRFFTALGEERYKLLAEKAAKYAASKYTVFPGQLVGLSGIGEFLLDMYAATGNVDYLRQADMVVSGILLYQVPRDHGIAFPGDELVRITTDFATGSAGIIAFIHRRIYADQQERLIFDCGTVKDAFLPVPTIPAFSV